jgi:hypothetical protein
MCWQRGYFKSAAAVREKRIAFQRRHFCNSDRLATVCAIDGEKPLPVFNGFNHGFYDFAANPVGLSYFGVLPSRAATRLSRDSNS